MEKLTYVSVWHMHISDNRRSKRNEGGEVELSASVMVDNTAVELTE